MFSDRHHVRFSLVRDIKDLRAMGFTQIMLHCSPTTLIAPAMYNEYLTVNTLERYIQHKLIRSII